MATSDYLDRYLSNLIDIANIKLICADEGNRDPIYGYSMWQPSSLANGMLGAATTLYVASGHDRNLVSTAHNYLLEALNARSFVGIGTMSGLSGVLYVLNVARRAGVDGYSTLRNGVINRVTNSIPNVLSLLRNQPRELKWEHYDLMNGLSGVALQLLLSQDQRGVAAAKEIAFAFAETICARTSDPFVRPTWSLSGANEPTPQDKEMYPYGDANLGMAHGIAGVLAYLAAYLKVTEDSSCSMICDHVQMLCEALLKYELTFQVSSECYYRAIPARLYLNEDGCVDMAKSRMTRAAWCYGTPGVACALYQASVVCDRGDISEIAESLLLSHLGAPESDLRLDGPTLCHGYGGLAFVLDCFYMWTKKNIYRKLRDEMISKMFRDHYEVENPLGFKHWMPDSKNGWRDATAHTKIDSVGLLEGSSGIALLMNSLENYGNDEAWRSCFGVI